MFKPNTDVISNVTNVGYTIKHPDGTTTDVTSAFNNSDQTAFILSIGFTQYEFNTNYITSRNVNGFVVHYQAVPSTIWTIKHNLGYTPKVNVIEHIDGIDRIILPHSVKIVDANTVVVTHTLGLIGTATVR